MFLVKPSPKPNAIPPRAIPSVLHPPEPERSVRVKKACHRCRIKKLKCDGRHPCIRCEQEKVICKQDRIERGTSKTDVKALSRNYIASLEAEQVYLLDALRQLCEAIPKNEKVQAIVERLQASGFDVSPIASPQARSPPAQLSLPLQSSGQNAWRTDGLPSPSNDSSSSTFGFCSLNNSGIGASVMPSFQQIQQDPDLHLTYPPANLSEAPAADSISTDFLPTGDPNVLLSDGNAWLAQQSESLDSNMMNGPEGNQLLETWWDQWMRVNHQLVP